MHNAQFLNFSIAKVVFFSQTAKYLTVICDFSVKNLAEYILLSIFALEYGIYDVDQYAQDLQR